MIGTIQELKVENKALKGKADKANKTIIQKEQIISQLNSELKEVYGTIGRQ